DEPTGCVGVAELRSDLHVGGPRDPDPRQTWRRARANRSDDAPAARDDPRVRPAANHRDRVRRDDADTERMREVAIVRDRSHVGQPFEPRTNVARAEGEETLPIEA